MFAETTGVKIQVKENGGQRFEQKTPTILGFRL